MIILTNVIKGLLRNSSTLATSCEDLTHWKRLWCWEGLGAGGEGDDRGWDGWMASPTWWTWVWVNSGSWWWTERPGVLWVMGSQRVGNDWATELNWTFTTWVLAAQSQNSGLWYFCLIPGLTFAFITNQNHQENLWKCKLLLPIPRVSDSVSLECGPKICISNKLPGDPDPAGLEIPLWEPVPLIAS